LIAIKKHFDMKWALKYSLGEIKECERGNNIEKRNAE
jgi:hypothetical protein